MGSYFSRSRGEVQEVDISANASYRYPPKNGNYFSSHFIMGGQKFETIQPEAYLFGENADLNFLGPKPYNVPYKVSSKSQPIKALRCLVNIRKDSLRLVKVPCSLAKTVTNDGENVVQDRQITAEEGEGPFQYNIEFAFDADCPCSITIYYNATEEMINKNVIYSPDPARDCSDTVHFNSGCNQQFCLPFHCIDPAKLEVSSTDWSKEDMKIPIVIQVCADCGPTVIGHSHITYAEFYKPSDNSWSIRTVKQKQAIDGVCYLIQEIFGIENKNTGSEDNDDDDLSDDDSSDCVVCLSETRDTLILPCKHLCLCSTCADKLRYQEAGCPICRQSFRALLQIRAVRKKTDTPSSQPSSRRRATDSNEENGEDEVEVVLPVPPGYEVISLIEAIKGNLSSSGAKERPRKETVTPSAHEDDVTVVDETATACSTTVTSPLSETEEITFVSNCNAKELEPKEITVVPAVLYENKDAHGSPVNMNNDTEEHTYEEIPAQEVQVQLPAGMADADSIETASGEPQNSATEPVPKAEMKDGATEARPTAGKPGFKVVGDPVEV